MPILYVHGVNVRSRAGFETFKRFARRYLAPEISLQPDAVEIRDVYWGELAFDPAFGGASRPRSRLIGMGVGDWPASAEQIAALGAGFDALDGRLSDLAQNNATEDNGDLGGGGLGTSGGAEDTAETQDLSDLAALEPDALSDVLAALVRAPTAGEENDTDPARAAREAALTLAADDLVQSGEAQQILARDGEPEETIDALLKAIDDRAEPADVDELAAMGFNDWLKRTGDRLGEAVKRTGDIKGYVISVVLAEARPPINRIVARFLGDVFVYLKDREKEDGTPGKIQSLLLAELKALHEIKVATGEPLIVVSHSMGGQLIYDAVTHYLPNTPDFAEITIDFWCAAASQVGYFEEAKLFKVSDPAHKTGDPVPFPDSNLGHWWNVWDYNDFLSFTVQDIIEGAVDQSFNSGTTLLQAHGAYLKTPSFYRRMVKEFGHAGIAVG